MKTQLIYYYNKSFIGYYNTCNIHIQVTFLMQS